MRLTTFYGALVGASLAIGAAACAETKGEAAASPTPPSTEEPTTQYVGDPEIGKRLFVTESCVVCHSIRGVGGKAAPALDVTSAGMQRAPMDFIAAMWAGAPIMVELQRLEVGYQINLSGEDLAHLAAFGVSPDAQDSFTLEDVPEGLQTLFLDQIYMEDDLQDRYRGEDWYNFPDDR